MTMDPAHFLFVFIKRDGMMEGGMIGRFRCGDGGLLGEVHEGLELIVLQSLRALWKRPVLEGAWPWGEEDQSCVERQAICVRERCDVDACAGHATMPFGLSYQSIDQYRVYRPINLELSQKMVKGIRRSDHLPRLENTKV